MIAHFFCSLTLHHRLFIHFISLCLLLFFTPLSPSSLSFYLTLLSLISFPLTHAYPNLSLFPSPLISLILPFLPSYLHNTHTLTPSFSLSIFHSLSLSLSLYPLPFHSSFSPLHLTFRGRNAQESRQLSHARNGQRAPSARARRSVRHCSYLLCGVLLTSLFLSSCSAYVIVPITMFCIRHYIYLSCSVCVTTPMTSCFALTASFLSCSFSFHNDSYPINLT